MQGTVMITLHIILQAVPGFCGILFTIASFSRYRAAKTSTGTIQLCGFALFTICELLLTIIISSTSTSTGLAEYAFVLNFISAVALILASLAFFMESKNSNGQAR